MSETLLIGCGNLGLSILEAFLNNKKKFPLLKKIRKLYYF